MICQFEIYLSKRKKNYTLALFYCELCVSVCVCVCMCGIVLVHMANEDGVMKGWNQDVSKLVFMYLCE